MLDRDESSALDITSPLPSRDFINKELLDAVHQLKSVALLLKGLYGQLNEEREVITMASGQMLHALEQFKLYIEQFESFEKSCQKKINDSLQIAMSESIRINAQAIADEVKKKTSDSIQCGINSLSQLSAELNEHRTQQNSSKLGLITLFFCAALSGGIVSGIFSYYLTAPTKDLKVKLAAGEMLIRSWSKLSQSEKDKITKG